MITSITDLMEDSLQQHSLLASQIPEDFPFRTQAAVQPLSPTAHLHCPTTNNNYDHRPPCNCCRRQRTCNQQFVKAAVQQLRTQAAVQPLSPIGHLEPTKNRSKTILQQLLHQLEFYLHHSYLQYVLCNYTSKVVGQSTIIILKRGQNFLKTSYLTGHGINTTGVKLVKKIFVASIVTHLWGWLKKFFFLVSCNIFLIYYSSIVTHFMNVDVSYSVHQGGMKCVFSAYKLHGYQVHCQQT